MKVSYHDCSAVTSISCIYHPTSVHSHLFLHCCLLTYLSPLLWITPRSRLNNYVMSNKDRHKCVHYVHYVYIHYLFVRQGSQQICPSSVHILIAINIYICLCTGSRANEHQPTQYGHCVCVQNHEQTSSKTSRQASSNNMSYCAIYRFSTYVILCG